MSNEIEKIGNIGIKKYEMATNDPKRFFLKAFIAGCYLGVAAILSFSLGALFQQEPSIAKLLYAASFGIGLVAIVFLGAELFTGNCFTTIIPVYQGKLKFKQLVPMWILCYVGNGLGIGLICALFVFSGALHQELSSYLFAMIEAKFNFDLVQLFIKGILCNFIVCLGSYIGIKIENVTTKFILMMIMVMAFVLPGFEHCIANMGTFVLGVCLFQTQISWSLLPLHMLISTLGNIVGGSILFALPIYLTFKK